MNPKFQIGDLVKVLADGEEGTVVSYQADASGFTYRITSKEVDIKAKEIINGFKTCKEDELELVGETPKEKKDEK